MVELTSATAWLVVPSKDTAAVLVVESTLGWTLPSVCFSRHTVPTDTSIADAVRRVLGVNTHLVRFLDVIPEAFGPDAVVLVSPIRDGEAPHGTRWLLRHELSRLAAHREAVGRWFDEEAGGPRPAKRVAWYQPGWFEETRQWVSEALAFIGHRCIGPPVPVTHTAYSAVSRISSTLGELYFKASPPDETHGAGVARLLSERAVGRVPAVVAADLGRGWWLSRAVAGELVGADTPAMEAVLVTLAELQIASADWIPDLVAMGCPEFTLDRIATLAPEVAGEDVVMRALDAEERARLGAAAVRIPSWCETAARAGMPMCLQHGDFGAHNALVTGDGAVLLDWRGFIGHPFVDVHLLLQGVTDLKRRRRTWRSYLSPWSAIARVHELVRSAEAVRPVFHAQYLLQVGLRAMAIEADPGAYEPWARRQIDHNLRWFALQLIAAAADDDPGVGVDRVD